MPSQNNHNIKKETANRGSEHNTRSSNEMEKSKDNSGINEFEIWRDFKKGKESAFILIYKLYFNMLVSYGRQFTSDKEIIKDAVQDLFIDLRKKRKKLPPLRYSIKFYLFKFLKNNMLQYLRNEKRIEKYRNKYMANRPTVDESKEFRIIQTQEHADLIRRLKMALKKLTRRQREALFYLYYNNLSYVEVQKLMRLKTVKSARNLIYSAIKSLKDYFIV